MLRRKFIQTLIIATSFGGMATISSAARASGGASSSSGSGASSSNSGGASSSSGGASSSRGGASSSRGGASSSSGGASRNSGGASIYCDANGTCTQETHDGLTSVSDQDLDDLLKSFK